jgi:tetratricopeptide (TPR) repeat protein
VPDFVKVLDFGIAKQDMGNQNSPRRLTTPGIAMGTPEYMAPEQAAGKAIDGRVDIYSVGAILYEMLTGDPPHAGANVMEILAKKATEAPTRPTELNPDVPDAIEEVVMRCLERDPDRRPQTMGALEYELNKSMKGRGSAVAAVLGLKPSEDALSGSSWGDESSRPRLFEAGAIQQRRGSMPSIPVHRSGTTGALPLSTTDDGGQIRVNSGRVASRDAVAETLAMDEKRDADLRAARRAGRWQKRLGWIGGFAFLGIAGFAAYQVQTSKWSLDTIKAWTSKAAPAPSKKITATAIDIRPRPEKHATPIKTVKAPPPPDDDSMSPAEIDRMLEWARRTAEGGRIISPPGDNLKELLDRIDKADPGNAQAEALKKRTTTMLARKGVLALKRGRLDEAEESFQSLVVLKPDDDWSKGRLARTLTLRAQRSLGKNKLQAALADATSALEMAPEDTGTQLTVADVHLAMGKKELAAGEYQRVLDVKPTDKHARIGLERAKATKPAKKARPKRRRGRGRR